MVGGENIIIYVPVLAFRCGFLACFQVGSLASFASSGTSFGLLILLQQLSTVDL